MSWVGKLAAVAARNFWEVPVFFREIPVWREGWGVKILGKIKSGGCLEWEEPLWVRRFLTFVLFFSSQTGIHHTGPHPSDRG